MRGTTTKIGDEAIHKNSYTKLYYIESFTSEKVIDLNFTLDKGNTPDMDFSETNFVDIIGPSELQIRTELTGDTTSNNIKFTDVNIVIKSYNI